MGECNFRMHKKEANADDWLAGVNPVLEQLRRDPHAIRKVIVARGASGRAAEVAEQAKRAGLEVEREDARRLRGLARGVAHQGIVALMRGFRYADWYDLLRRRPACLLLADQVTDPRNFGALVRSADATGVGGVVISQDRSVSVTAVVAKAAAGATAVVPIARVVNLARALEELQRAGYWIIGLDGAAPRSLFDFSFPERCALVVGAEGRGLRPLTRAKCDHLISLPMVGGVGSLNVSVAAAVALYERIRQARGARVSTD
jgi:23S rRNA (guanosine2251-2'-O)-methyltransferase